MRKSFPLLITVSLLLTSCAHLMPIRLQNIHLGMSQDEVVQKLGKPFNVIGSRKFEKGEVEIWEYRRVDWWDGSITEQYWVYFLNGQLERWGRPGDWSKEADRVYKFKFGGGANLTAP